MSRSLEETETDRKTILLAEDFKDNAFMLRRLLKLCGYRAFIAEDGREAVEKALEINPDLIILDVSLPVMTGFEACETLKSNEKTRHIPIIFISAHDSEAFKERGLSLGAIRYFTKPINFEEVLHFISPILETTNSENENNHDEAPPEPITNRKVKDPFRICGTVLNGKYELIGFAGSGGMGAVYRALNLRDRNTVAVKILQPHIVTRNPEYAELFEREAQNAEGLDHPHIVKVFDTGKDEDLSYMVMEWVEGRSVEDVLTQGQLPLDRLTNIFEQICSAVAFAHERSIIHLDLKPGNILLLDRPGLDDFVKVIDFGLSRVISKESGTTVTKFRGTHQFCAPEQFGGKVSHRSDIYSLGATLYYLLTGVIPFGTSYINAKIHPNLELPEIPSLARQRDVPPRLDKVVRRALNKSPELRQQSATQLFEEFKDALSTDNKALDPADIRLANLLQIEKDMRRALEREGFILHYQPIVALENFLLRGFEALVRWQHPERGFVSPLDFIPIAEETGMIVPLGEWVMREACRQMHGWQKRFQLNQPLFVTVNLSSKQFSQTTLISTLATILQETGVEPQSIKLEVSESVISENIDTAMDTLRQLRELGVKLSIDDFGTGYSSLSYLHRFPIDTLKIDRSFVTRMSENNENTEIVRTIVVLAQSLGMDVVAEGVETNEQLVLLQKLGCENGQGYFFSKPVNAEGAEKIIAETYAALSSVSRKVIEKVRMEDAQAVIEASKPPHKTAQRQALNAEEAVLKWLWEQYPRRVRFAKFRSSIDLIIDLPGGASQGVDVRYFPHANDIHSRLRESINSLRRISKDEGYSSLLLVLVASEQNVTFMLNEAVNEIDADVPHLSITVGRLTDASEFIALRTATTM